MATDKQNGTNIFRKRLMEWHIKHNDRQMPWKGEKDPYKIWLSEIILQQTRVEQGWAYYEKFIQHYPTVHRLAEANDDDVFKLWEGLGYYTRCKNLLATARIITGHYNGKFPVSYDDIIRLKGIGPYTAAAIASFAFQLPHAVLDGNVYRVLARYFGIAVPSDSPQGKKLFTNLADNCLDTTQPGKYNQAIMDFGATVCIPANPLCNNCPLQKTCVAFEKKMVGSLPVKTKKLQKRSRWFTYFIVEQEDKILVRKRTQKDIWQNLHEFFVTESAGEKNWEDKLVKQFLKTQLGITVAVVGTSEVYPQQLTHQTIYARFIHINTTASFSPPGDYFFQPKKTLGLLAFPKTITQFLNQARV